MDKKLNAGKGLNLAAGIVDILGGTASIVNALLLLFLTVLAGTILGGAGEAGETAGAALGIIMVVPMVIFLAVGITVICFGASNCKAHKLNGTAYVERKGKFLGFLITEAILLVGMILVMVFLLPGDILTIAIVAAMALTFVLRLVAYILVVKSKPVNAAPVVEETVQE